MTGIGPINGVIGAAPMASATADARQAALGAIGEIGGRVLAWVEASGGARAGEGNVNSGFQPDAGVLARGGDVYGLGEIASEVVAQFGGTPAEEGALRRSLEDFTREAVVQLAGLSGASADRQMAGVHQALDTAGRGSGPEGVDGVAQRLDAATAVLARRNGN